MARVRSVDFLPEIFQTDANKQFLAATLDQLIQEPKFKKTQGYIGRTVGPGVNPNDKYVIEPNKTRADYQLEPGVISLDPADTGTIQNAITYPGITDALGLQGAITTQPDRLYTSEYYTWDPFIDYDTFVNFSQYYWLENGPAVVDVAATGVPSSKDFTVTRANGVYTFSNTVGNNPTISLLRGGNYTFQVAQNAVETINFRVQRQGVASYLIDFESNPTLTLARGNTYVFTLNQIAGFPFWIKTAPTTGTGDQYNSGVQRNGSSEGNITFTVPQDAPDTLYYSCQTQSLMHGTISVVNGTPGTGSGFWIQTNPGVNGKNPITPNISSREVLGVTNNGIDLGTVSFNVPVKNAQNFYYNLPLLANGGTVDLVTGLKFDQINGARLDQFVAQYGGIDGITSLNTRTLVFTNQNVDPESGGWVRQTGFDPLVDGVSQTNYQTTLTIGIDSTSTSPIAVVSTAGWPTIGSLLIDFEVISYTGINGNTFTGITRGQDGSSGAAHSAGATVGLSQIGVAGSYDSIPFSLTTPVPVDQYYNVWRISYVNNGSGTYLQLNSIQTIDPLDKFSILYGTEYANTQWYKLESGFLQEIPVLSADLDELWYQDGTDPEIFGRIRLLETTQSDTIYINDILGKKNYTSPNGVVFTNGLKVRFSGSVVPSSYASGSTTVVCSSTAAGLNLITCDTTENMLVGQNIQFSGTVFGGVAANTTYYVRTIFSDSQFTISTVLGGPAVQLTSANGIMTGVASQDPQYYVSGVGIAIELLLVSDFITPEVIDVEASLLGTIDYLTISRASKDLNAWTRSNRWFHIDVLNATGKYNNTPVDLLNDLRGKRPILQFRPGVRLFNMGTASKAPVNVIDFTETDALSNIEGSTGYTTNGYTLVDGSRVVFAADTDPNVRNKIYVVNFITPDTVPPLIAQPIINLVVASDGLVEIDNCAVCLSGTQLGVSFWYDGVNWLKAQQKSSVQQAPLFNVFDSNGISFADRTQYPSSTFIGSKLLSYAQGTSTVDPVLNLQLRYLTISNVGDIVFDNNLYADTFIYVVDNNSITQAVSTGYVYEYASRAVYQRQLGWQTAVVPSIMRQQFKFVYDTAPLKLDVAALPNSTTIVPSVKIFVGSVFQDPGTYTITTTDTTTQITFTTVHVPGDVIEVEVISNQISQVAFYQIPINLDKNPLNNNSDYFTLGTIRNHYESICQNLTTLTGKINGSNNTRDLGNIGPYGTIILQQSSPLTLAGYFMRSEKYNIFGALEYNSREYQKFKGQMLEAVTRQTIQYQPISDVLDTAIADITLGKIDSNPFYWSDMLPATSLYTTLTYTVSFITTDTFDTNQVYNYKSANYLGMNVYLNDIILTRGLDYEVATNGPRIIVLATLAVGDTITVQEYATTYGTFVPNTPTKLGCYPAWRPAIITVKTSSGDQLVIQGHDGSQTPLFGDIRDDVLLEFETRIFNNLKLDGNPVPLTLVDVLPGQFRETGYSYAEINQILSASLLTYVGWNKLDYNIQKYNQANAFTWNYSASTNRLNNQNLLGAWRGINRYFYDTQQPEQAPWEMLGFAIKPDWWEITYGPGPYTAENLVLWDDLAAGYIADPLDPHFDYRYARPASYGPTSEPPRGGVWNTSRWGTGPYPKLEPVVPTGSMGELLAPIESVVGTFNDQQTQKNWVAGDGGPVEASWWNSSDYPFAVMRLLALTRPAKFFALFADRDLYRYQEEFGQYLYNDRYRLNANDIQVYGNGVSKASYIDWIVDYNRVLGQDSTQALENDLSNIDVRLCYRMASFSDKQYIKLYTEKSSPNSTNTSLLIPDNSYDLLLYKNQPFDRSIYSSVVVQVVEGGWAVFGYSTARPYFNILTSIPAGKFQTFSVAGVTIQVPSFYTQTVTQVPYGFTFTTRSAVADFLLSYGKLLEQQGFQFDDQVNGYVLDWNQMVNEYLYWSQQGWEQGSLINLNPLASKLSVTKEQAIVDNISAQTIERVLLNQNKQDFPVRDLNIVRIDNTFTIQPLTTQSLSFIDMRYTSYESMIVLNNTSLFGDLIYEPTTGARQSRLYLVAATSTEWNGSVDAQGFILNQDNIKEWSGVNTYTKGTIVKYKGAYWSAATIVQPSTKFNYNDWNQSDYTLIQQGLLPNLANKADQLVNSYNINSANLETDNDLLSYGLIGYRPRQYLTALNLDDVSQLNVYRQFIDTKGTILSVDLLGQAKLNKEVADYTVYENWAVQRSVYGANANRRFFDLRLNAANLISNPSLVEVVQPNQPSSADQTILLSDVWNSSFPLTTTQILPTTTTSITDTALPSAGYVNLNDADITVFDLSNPAGLSANLSSIIVGTSIWVARVNDYDWNIYRAQAVGSTIAHVCDNLNGTSIVKFNGQSGLSVGDKLIIRFFDAEINGVYPVLTVPNLTSVTIPFSFTGDRVVVNGTGIGFTLKTMRVAQASDVLNLPYTKQILPGAQVWVDDNGEGLWEVLKKENPFVNVTALSPVLLDASEQYGASVAQALNRTALFVGSPRYGFAIDPLILQGGIYVYVKNFSDQYTPISPLPGQDAILTLTTTGIRGYGNSVDVGNQTWGVGGASASLGPAAEVNNGYAVVLYRDPTAGGAGSNPWLQTQLLTLPGTTNTTTPGAGEFGYSVAMSLDEQWMYIGAPGLNYVYAYGQVPWQNQTLTYISNGISTTADISDTIQINNSNQITITQDGRVLTLGSDYTVNGSFTTVTFTPAPTAGSRVVIQRNYTKGYTASGTTYDLTTYLYTVSAASIANKLYSFYVTVNGIQQRPFIDYTYTSGNLVFYSAPTPGLAIAVTAQNYYELAGSITVAGLGATDRFGQSIACSTDGRQLIVGCKNATVNSLTEAGSVYVFDRNVQKFIVSNAATTTYTVLGTVSAPVSVLLNNVFLTNEVDGILDAPGTFSVSGNNITLNDTLAVGDVIEIEINQFVQQQLVTQDTVTEFTNFGQAVDLCPYNCSLYVGAPQSSISAYKGGVVERDVNVARSYGTITATVAPSSTALTVGDTLRVNNVDIVVPAATSTVSRLQGLANNINAYAPNATAAVSTTGYLTISVTNTDAAVTGNKLQVAPGSTITTTGIYAQLGFEAFAFTQTIESPIPTIQSAFGASLAINDTALNLVVGAPQGSLYLPNTFDYDPVTETVTTTFDGNSTTFFSPVTQSGVVYTYDYLPSSSNTLATPGKFVFGQQVETDQVSTLDQFGYAVSYNSGVLVATAPGEDFGDSTAAYGAAFVFENPTQTPAWSVQYIQQPVVDVRLLTSAYIYDRITSAKTEFFDFFNPLQGKILGAAQENIDYIGAVDPAGYNVGPVNNRGMTWGSDRVGEMWWDISTVRFIDPNQDNITYASRRWGQVFPGSRIDVYQWIVSSQAPANYPGPGIPFNNTSYVVSSRLNRDGTFNTEYYFWVRGITDTSTQQGKTLSAATVASYIQDPRASGIAYIAPINASTIAIYNAVDYIVAADSILTIEFDQQFTTSNVHAEYELIAQGRPDAFLSDNLYRKMQDSFCGVDTNGAKVPDPNLPPAQRYGIQVRPRQSMFVNRFLALQNYIQRANAVFKLYPITENRSFALLNSAEPEPAATTGAWDLRVANLEILGFQDIYAVALGYTYLVVTDSSNRGLWTIYTVEESAADPLIRELMLSRVQNYNTRDYWSYVNWYLPGYNSSTKILTEVPNYASLATINAVPGVSVKVTANAQGKFEIYLRTDINWERVGLQDGTIEISAEIYDYSLGRFGFDVEVFDAQYFDQEPVIETRKIIQAINEELLIGDLLIERNKALTLMFNFILSELQAPEWLVKTSLIDVDHRIRELVPFQNYIRDNQEFVSDYIQEVKPYHVQVRAFNLTYNGQDNFLGGLTDFDVPAYYDTNLAVPQYISPILLPYTQSTAQSSNTLSNTPANSTIWADWPYSQWFDNYTLHLDSVTVINQGVGYTVPPIVTVVPGSGDTTGSGAEAEAIVNAFGKLVSITVTNPGSGYTQTPNIVIDGGNPGGATAYANMANGLVRSFRTVIKYDRYQYNTSIETWSADGTYENGTLVRYDNRVWQANSADGSTAVSGPDFNLEDWKLIDAATLSGVNRTMGFYVPGVNEAGLELPLLIDGISYPGVQVWGDYFLGSSPTNLTVNCTSSSALNNRITCNQTLRMVVNSPIRFYGTVFGGIVEGQVYYVNSIVSATEFTVSTTYNGTVFVLSTATGLMVAYIPEPLDATYASSFTDLYLGLRPTDINIDGGEFIGPYEGHAPEELINGSEYDTLDFRVYTTPGGDWTGRGHGFQISTINYNYDPTISTYSWAGVIEYPTEVIVYNLTTGFGLTPDINYTINYANQTITVISGVLDNNIIGISLYEIGGGNQLYRENYTGEQAAGQVIVPISADLIYSIPTFVNGVYLPGVTWSAYVESTTWNIETAYAKQDIVKDLGTYYRALRSVPAGVLLTNVTYWIVYTTTTQSLVDFGTTFGTSDGISLAVFGIETPQYSWSTPQTQYIVATTAQAASRTFTLTNSLQGTNPANIIVTRNGLRLRPAAGIEWFGDTVGATDFVVGRIYTITSLGTTNWNIVVGAIAAGSFIIGQRYTIADLGAPTATNFVAIGAASNTVGVTFIATGIGSGDGTAYGNDNFSVGQAIQVAEVGTGTGTASSTSFTLPQRTGYSESLIDPATDITVYVDNVLQIQSIGSVIGDYSVFGSTNIQVVFAIPPADGARILISVSTLSDYRVVTNASSLEIVPLFNAGDVFSITTFNDTAQQNILTLLWQGPVSTGITLNEPYDSTAYDPLFIGSSVSGTSTAGTFVINDIYTILTAGTTDFIAIGAADNNPGTVFVATGVGSGTGTACPITSTFPAGTFVIGDTYTILTAGTTNFVAIGAANNNLGTVFVATGVGSGTGTASGVTTERSDATNALNSTAGSFDYTVGDEILVNNFDLGRIVEANRLWVTLDGYRLIEGQDFTVEGQYLILSSGTINSSQLVVATEFAENQVPERMEFRIFQDMRGIQTTFRMTPTSTTVVAQAVSATDDIIYVTDAHNLSVPNLAEGYFGVITINSERILYRNINTALNTVSGLQRGTAGTAAASHTAGTPVYDMGIGNAMVPADQNYIVSNTTVGNGVATVFSADDIDSAEVTITINAGNFVIGHTYIIATVGTTNFVAIGAASNTVGVTFVATGSGSGTGTATTNHSSIEVYVGGLRSSVGYLVTAITTGVTYTIASIGNTDWYAIGLSPDQFPAPGVVFTATNNIVSAVNFRTGYTYTILTVGTTDWNSIGYVGTPTISGTFTRNSTVLTSYGTGTASGVVDQGVVGETLASNYYQITDTAPAEVTFITADDLPAPADGVEVTILQRRGVTWYAPGIGEPSNGEPLQLTNTEAARFLQGK